MNDSCSAIMFIAIVGFMLFAFGYAVGSYTTIRKIREDDDER